MGVNARRLSSRHSLTEQILAEEWLEKNTPSATSSLSCPILQSMLSRSKPEALDSVFGHEYDPISQRDAEVGATVIQWLGTHIGNLFIRDALKRADGAQEESDILKDLETCFKYEAKSYDEVAYLAKSLIYLRRNSDPIMYQYIDPFAEAVFSACASLAKAEGKEEDFLKAMTVAWKSSPGFPRKMIIKVRKVIKA